MTYRGTRALLAGIAALALASVAEARPNTDAFANSRERVVLGAAKQRLLDTVSAPGMRPQIERRLGVPSVLWAADPTGGLPLLPDAEAAARSHLGRLAPRYGLSASDVRSAEPTHVHDTGRGGVIVTFRQRLDGIRVFREDVKILMAQDHGLIGITGWISPARLLTAPARFDLDARAAAAAAVSDLRQETFSPGDLTDQGIEDAVHHFTLTERAEREHDASTRDTITVERVLYRMPTRYVPAYEISLAIADRDGGDGQGFGYVVSAVDADVLSRVDQTAQHDHEARKRTPEPTTPFTYRVFAGGADGLTPLDSPYGHGLLPHPSGTVTGLVPGLAETSLKTLSHGPISTGDPWLAPDADSTRGNNAIVYSDVTRDRTFPGTDRGLYYTPGSDDRFGALSAPRTFDYVHDFSSGPASGEAQVQSGLTQAFYTVNYLHDLFYDAGFDESAGNGQQDNYGRGGEGGDRIDVFTQGWDLRNNAAMFTRPDGSQSEMYLYLWDGKMNVRLDVTAPAGAVGSLPVGTASFGAQTFDLTDDVVLAHDGAGALDDDACEELTNAGAIDGKVALIPQPKCNFFVAFERLQAAGATAVVIRLDLSEAFNLGGSAPQLTIPIMSTTASASTALAEAAAGGTARVRLQRATEPDRDVAFDGGVVTHEFGHFVSNRLIGNAFGLQAHQSRGLGEGWSDFMALLTTVDGRGAATGYRGAYTAGASWVARGVSPNSDYFGARRAPYSVDPAKNAWTLRHIAKGEAHPAVPLQTGSHPDGNAQVHNTGEVWASMLWEGYVSLLNAHGFEDAQATMRDYLIASLKLTPTNPTLVQARDALLMTAYAADERDFTRFWKAFALRGAGTTATVSASSSTSNFPFRESYDAGSLLQFESAGLTDDVRSCDRGDGHLDTNESGRLRVNLKNIGASDLRNGTVTLTSPDPRVRFSPSTIRLPTTKPFDTAQGSTKVTLLAPARRDVITIRLEFTGSDYDGAPGVATVRFDTGLSIARAVSATESFDVEDRSVAWTSTGTPNAGLWSPQRFQPGLVDRFWHGQNPRTVSDHALVSPPLAVGPTGLRATLKHRYDLERGPLSSSDPAVINWDGGVVEVSTDDGTTWTDAGRGYIGTLDDRYGNPLAGRQAYSGRSPGYPEWSTLTALDLGSQYAGKTIRIRFRIGTDNSFGADGWEIDEVAFDGLVGTPFDAYVTDPGCPTPKVD